MLNQFKTKSVHSFFDKKFKEKKFENAYKNACFLMDIAYEISKARNRVGLSQTQLAEKINTTQSVVSRIEHGNQNLSITMLKRIADVLGRSLDIRLDQVCNESLRWDLRESLDYDTTDEIRREFKYPSQIKSCSWSLQ